MLLEHNGAISGQASGVVVGVQLHGFEVSDAVDTWWKKLEH
jgi:hypothetical protein